MPSAAWSVSWAPGFPPSSKPMRTPGQGLKTRFDKQRQSFGTSLASSASGHPTIAPLTVSNCGRLMAQTQRFLSQKWKKPWFRFEILITPLPP